MRLVRQTGRSGRAGRPRNAAPNGHPSERSAPSFVVVAHKDDCFLLPAPLAVMLLFVGASAGGQNSNSLARKSTDRQTDGQHLWLCDALSHTSDDDGAECRLVAENRPAAN